MRKRDGFVWVVTAVTITFVVLAAVNTKKRTKHFQNIVNLSEKSPYETSAAATIYGVEPKGVLGDMYNCLVKYRPTAIKKPSKGTSGASGPLILQVDDYQVYLGINTGEVTSAKLARFSEDGDYLYGSSSVAVNCDISLLNQID